MSALPDDVRAFLAEIAGTDSIARLEHEVEAWSRTGDLNEECPTPDPTAARCPIPPEPGGRSCVRLEIRPATTYDRCITFRCSSRRSSRA